MVLIYLGRGRPGGFSFTPRIVAVPSSMDLHDAARRRPVFTMKLLLNKAAQPSPLANASLGSKHTYQKQGCHVQGSERDRLAGSGAKASGALLPEGRYLGMGNSGKTPRI